MKIVCLILVLFLPNVAGAWKSELSENEKFDEWLKSIPVADATFYHLYIEERQTDRDQSMEYLENFISRVDTTVSNVRIAALCDTLSGYFKTEKYLFSKSITYLERALKIYSVTGNSGRCSDLQYRLAELYYRKGKYHRSFDYVTKAMESYRSADDVSGIMKCNNLLGILFYVCRDYGMANKYFMEYESCARNLRDTSAIIQALHNIAVYSNGRSDTTSAISFIEKSIDLSRMSKNENNLCRLYLNISSVYSGIGQYGKAAEYLEKARPFLKTVEEYGNYCLNAALLEYYGDDYRASVNHVNRALKSYENGEFDIERQKCYNLLNICYRHMGNIDLAYAALSNYFAIELEMSKSDVFLELFSLKNELVIREKEKIMNSKQERTVVISAIIIFVFVVGGLVVAFLLYRRSFKLQQKESELANQKKILEVVKMQQYNMYKMSCEIVEKLTALKKNIGDEQIRSGISAICDELRESKDNAQLKNINRFIPNEEDRFYQNLIKAFPSLTVNERRLCVLLHQNLSSKDISEITRQSPHSVNIARTRLRSKLNIVGKNISIQEFLSQFD